MATRKKKVTIGKGMKESAAKVRRARKKPGRVLRHCGEHIVGSLYIDVDSPLRVLLTVSEIGQGRKVVDPTRPVSTHGRLAPSEVPDILDSLLNTRYRTRRDTPHPGYDLGPLAHQLAA